MSETVEPLFEAGWFEDWHHRRWFCAMRSSRTIVCEGTNGQFTAASPETFQSWGWKRVESAGASQ